MSIEKRIFENIVKEVTKDSMWAGSIEQNRLCDFKISKSVKSSFQYYEKSRKAGDVSYFKFTK